MTYTEHNSGAVASHSGEVFALTDEQILGVEPEELHVTSTSEAPSASRGPSTAAATASARDDRKGDSRKDFRDSANRRSLDEVGKGLTPEGVSYTEPPKWLAREMNDPWVGEEARELWEGVQRAQREAAAYREVIGTPEEARALREIYPGGVAEARSAAERARELGEIDTAIFGAPGRGAEELRAGRVQLVERLYAQDPGAFREMVEAGVRLLERAATGDRKELNAETQRAQSTTETQNKKNELGGSAGGQANAAQAGVPVPQEVAGAYREFERAANAELERSVGGEIRRALEEALPNLKSAGSAQRGESLKREGQAPPLPDRLLAAVKDEVEAGLRSDVALGEQVARILNGKRFDGAARAHVVRLIDVRAQQLVPGAVKKVVGSWTAATLGTKSPDARAESQRSIAGSGNKADRQNPKNGRDKDSGRRLPPGRVDYRKWSDEQILEM